MRYNLSLGFRNNTGKENAALRSHVSRESEVVALFGVTLHGRFKSRKVYNLSSFFLLFLPSSHTSRRSKVGPLERPLQALYCFKAEVILLLAAVETKARGLLQAQLCERKRTATLFDSGR